MIDIPTNPINIPLRETQGTIPSSRVPTQMSTDSGIFSRTQSVVDGQSANHNGDSIRHSSDPHHHNRLEDDDRRLLKKASKDSGIDMRGKRDSTLGVDSLDPSNNTKDSHLSLANSSEDDMSSLPPNESLNNSDVERPVVPCSDSCDNNNESDVKNVNTISNGDKEHTSKLKHMNTEAVDLLDDIPSELINRSDGLKQRYFYTDENGSPKIYEELIEKEKSAYERRMQKKNAVTGTEDVDIFGCLGFAKLSKFFKPNRKYTHLSCKSASCNFYS